jgi:YD repeat-containing protein
VHEATGIDAAGVATGWRTSQTNHTPTGQTAEQIDAAGQVTRTEYDALDRPVRTIDAAGRVTGRRYNAAGELIAELDAVGTPLEQATASYNYTANGQRAEMVDAKGNRTRFTYDGHDRPSEVVYADETFEQDDLRSDRKSSPDPQSRWVPNRAHLRRSGPQEERARVGPAGATQHEQPLVGHTSAKLHLRLGGPDDVGEHRRGCAKLEL